MDSNLMQQVLNSNQIRFAEPNNANSDFLLS